MESHKKERSSRQHNRIDPAREREGSETQNGGLFLHNPMCSDFSGGAPGLQARASSERGSFKKQRPKSPAILRFFVRGGSRKESSADEEDYASSGSDHEDPFSPRDKAHPPDIVHTNKYTDHLAKSGKQDANLPHFHKSSKRTNRDSGFASERGSVSQRDDRDGLSQCTEDSAGWDEQKSGGMAALELLHHQLQILVKTDGAEPDEGMAMQEEVVCELRRQLETARQSLEPLEQSVSSLRLSLVQERQRAGEAEAKLSTADNRYVCLEQRYIFLAHQFHALTRKFCELQKHQQKTAVLQQMGRVHAKSSTPTLMHKPPHRAESMRETDRHRTQPSVAGNTSGIANGSGALKRPNSAQGLGYTETCV